MGPTPSHLHPKPHFIPMPFHPNPILIPSHSHPHPIPPPIPPHFHSHPIPILSHSQSTPFLSLSIPIPFLPLSQSPSILLPWDTHQQGWGSTEGSQPHLGVGGTQGQDSWIPAAREGKSRYQLRAGSGRGPGALALTALGGMDDGWRDAGWMDGAVTAPRGPPGPGRDKRRRRRGRSRSPSP